MKQILSAFVLMMVAAPSFASSLSQFQGRYKVDDKKCSLNKYENNERAYITIQGAQKNVISIQMYGDDARLYSVQIDNRIERKNGYVVTMQGAVAGNVAKTLTTYSRDGKLTQKIEQTLTKVGNRVIFQEVDSQMARPVHCELIRN